MAGIQGAEGNSPETVGPEKGKVSKVRREWMVYEDGAMAHKAQEDEFNFKYGMNRFHRRTVRSDIPVAKVCQSEEEERMQRERMEFLERQKMIADEDARIAQQMAQQMEIEERRKQEVAHDENLTRAMIEEMVTAEQQKKTIELRDEEMARQLQEKETEKYKLKVQEHELRKQRKRLQEQNKQQAARVLGSEADADAGDQRNDFYVPPDDSMPAEHKKELQELQDEELARLLQDQEHKRGANVDKDKLRKIEAKDAEIARMIQEQEKLKAKKHKHKHKHQRQNSTPESQTECGESIGSGGMPERSRSLQEPSHHPHMSNPAEVRTPSPVPEDRHPQHASSNPARSRQPLPTLVDRPPSPLLATEHMHTRQLNERERPSVNNNSAHSDPTYRNVAPRPPHSQNGQQPTVGGNVFSAIDPTVQGGHRDGGDGIQNRLNEQRTPPRLLSPTGDSESDGDDTEPSLSYYLRKREEERDQRRQGGQKKQKPAQGQGHGSSHPRTSNAYEDIDDSHFAPVQNQKRDSLQKKKGSKKGNCKQQ